MPNQTLSAPRYKHFTLDPLHPIGDESETVPPSAAFNEDEAEQVKALSDVTVESYEDRLRAERKEAEGRAKAGLPKPSELLAQREGRVTAKREKTESKSSSSKS